MKKEETSCNFKFESEKLRNNGPERFYFIYGKEDYLRDHYLTQLKELCLGDSGDGFGYYRFDGFTDINSFSIALDTMPFISDRSYIEFRDADFNRIPDGYFELLSQIPDYCTLVFAPGTEFEPDNRTKSIKFLRENANCLFFGSQYGRELDNWIARRFKAAGKNISSDAIKRLEFISGEFMNALIPEIEKVAAYAKGDTVTVQDVNAVANHIPEASAFELVDKISEKKNNDAIALLSELLNQKGIEIPEILGALSYQFRQLYAAKLCEGKGLNILMDALGTRSDYRVRLVSDAAKRFSLKKIHSCIEYFAEAEYNMKTSVFTPEDAVKDLVIKLIN